jgi:nucleotide-binding universal stress UspA family protein
MRYLLATDSVHTTAAACDYLDGRLDPDDAVTVVTVPSPDGDARDAADALNAANARLLGRAELETERLDADGEGPATAILERVAEWTPDVVIVGPHAGVPDADPTLGSTTRRIIEGVDVPVVVVPLSL